MVPVRATTPAVWYGYSKDVGGRPGGGGCSGERGGTISGCNDQRVIRGNIQLQRDLKKKEALRARVPLRIILRWVRLSKGSPMIRSGTASSIFATTDAPGFQKRQIPSLRRAWASPGGKAHISSKSCRSSPRWSRGEKSFQDERQSTRRGKEKHVKGGHVS